MLKWQLRQPKSSIPSLTNCTGLVPVAAVHVTAEISLLFRHGNTEAVLFHTALQIVQKVETDIFHNSLQNHRIQALPPDMCLLNHTFLSPPC